MENYEQNEQNAKENKLKAMERLSNKMEEGQGLRYTIGKEIHTHTFEREQEVLKHLREAKEGAIKRIELEMGRIRKGKEINKETIISIISAIETIYIVEDKIRKMERSIDETF